MKVHLNKWFYVATLAFSLNSVFPADEHEPHHKMMVGDDVLVKATATVDSVNLEKRELTLKGSLGEISTVTVDKAVQRLDEIKPGDQVKVQYYLAVAAELREPTSEEKENPIMVVEGTAKAPKSASPAAGELNVLRVVATVEGLERPTRMLTLKGPRGNYLSVKARDVKKLEKLHLGDTIVVTFTEALAIGVEKADK
jgi:hypothetical protein